MTEDLRSKDAVFVEDLSEVPAGSTLIFSAHGVSQGVRREVEARGLKVFDAICPLVWLCVRRKRRTPPWATLHLF